MKPVTTTNAMLIVQKYPLDSGSSTCFWASVLNHGSETLTSARATMNANTATRTDSHKNCWMSCFLAEPIDFRMPTSFARCSDRAVLKFMKLMQGSNNTNAPTTPKSQTYWI